MYVQKTVWDQEAKSKDMVLKTVQISITQIHVEERFAWLGKEEEEEYS